MRLTFTLVALFAAVTAAAACSGAPKHYQVDAVVPVSGHEGIRTLVTERFRTMGYNVYEGENGLGRLRQLGFV